VLGACPWPRTAGQGLQAVRDWADEPPPRTSARCRRRRRTTGIRNRAPRVSKGAPGPDISDDGTWATPGIPAGARSTWPSVAP